MSESSITGGASAPLHPDGKDVDALGPSDTSDSGSDVQGERPMSTGADNPGEWGAVVADLQTDTDASGTGERASAEGDAPMDGADILPDRIIDDPAADDDPSRRRESLEAAGLSDEEADDERGDIERGDEIGAGETDEGEEPLGGEAGGTR